MNEFVEVKKKEFLEKFKWFFNSNPNESLEMLIFLDTALHQAIAVGLKEAEKMCPLIEELKEENGFVWVKVPAMSDNKLFAILPLNRLQAEINNHDTKKE